jgi:hypothetical protein
MVWILTSTLCLCFTLSFGAQIFITTTLAEFLVAIDMIDCD